MPKGMRLRCENRELREEAEILHPTGLRPRRRAPALLAATLLLAAPPLLLAAPSKILLQVRDPENQPIREIRLTYGGVRSLPTNGEGATELSLPANHPPGLPIKLFLVANPKKDWFLTNPTINVPAEGFPAELVVMSRSVFRRLASEVRAAQNSPPKSGGTTDAEELKKVVADVLSRYHLKPDKLEETIRSFGETQSLQDQGIAAYLAGQYSQAEGFLRAASERRAKDFVDSELFLVSALIAQRKFPEAEKEARKALGAQPENDYLHTQLGWLLDLQEKWGEAETAHRNALALAEQQFGPSSEQFAFALGDLADTFGQSGRREEAVDLRRRVVEIEESVHGGDHPHVALDLSFLATDLESSGCLAEALTLRRRALRIEQAHGAVNDPDVQANLGTTAALLYRLGRSSEALDLVQWNLPAAEYDAALKRKYQRASRSRVMPPWTQVLKARVLFDLSRMDEAEAALGDALAFSEQSFGPESVPMAEYLAILAELLQATNRLGEAEEAIRRALAIDRAQTRSNPLRIARDLDHLGDLLLATDCLREAEPLLLEAVEIYGTHSRQDGWLVPGTTEAFKRYRRLLEKQGQPEAAIQARLAELQQGLPPAAPAPLCTPPPDTDTLTARPPQ